MTNYDGLKFKQSVDDLEIEYCIEPGIDYRDFTEEKRMEIAKSDAQLDLLLQENMDKINALNKQIESVTVKAEAEDYVVAACCGVFAGLLDVFMVGEVANPAMDVADPTEWAKKQTEDTVIQMAKFLGSNATDVNGAIKFLTENGGNGGPGGLDLNAVVGALSGQLSPTVGKALDSNSAMAGLAKSLLTQFTGYNIGSDENGAIVASELLNKEMLGSNTESKVMNGVSYWFLKMVMEAARSGKIADTLGIPAPLIDLAKDMATLPMFRDLSLTDNDLVKLVSDMSGKLELMKATGEERTLLNASTGVKFSKAATPVIINECVVRSFYFITRLAEKIREDKITTLAQFKAIELKDVLPVNNATVSRMMAVSIGAMEAVDIAGAAIKGAVAAVGTGAAGAAAGTVAGPVGTAGAGMSSATAAFWKTFVLNINFAGIGRLGISCVTEANIGAEREKLLTDRINVLNDRLNLMNSKVFYNEADMWIAAEMAGKAIDEAYSMIGHTSEAFNEMVEEVTANINKVTDYVPKIEEKNPGLTDKMKDILKWGI